MGRKSKAGNDFDSFLNECNTYVWEWYVPEGYVRFGIPSLNGLWIDDKEKIFRIDTVLEKVHPDDINKIFVRRNSPLYKSDEMFEIDFRVNATGAFEWYGFRGRILRRDKKGSPTYIRGVAINVDNRVRVQQKFLRRKEQTLLNERQKTHYCIGALQEVVAFIRHLASSADTIITGVPSGSQAERLSKIRALKEECERILELSDKVKKLAIGDDMPENNEVRQVALWEHLAELQQVYSLKVRGAVKIYFTNLYDTLPVVINVKLLDLLIENVINAQLHNTRTGYLTMSYTVKEGDILSLVITCTESDTAPHTLNSVLTEGGMGVSVCRLLARRLGGDIHVGQQDAHRIQYEILLPLKAAEAPTLSSHDEMKGGKSAASPNATTPTEGSGDGSSPSPSWEDWGEAASVSVLVGSAEAMGIYRNQHLFNMLTTTTTDQTLRVFQEKNPDIVFIDYNMKGNLGIAELIEAIHRKSGDTPIIVTADYAHRVLHKQVRMLGARYLVTNPVSLRKINLMIKKYLK